MSWKTTACGILGLIAAVAVGAKALLDSDPNTTINIGEIIAAILVVAPSLGLIFARDNNKSSEEVGAK
jgi:hypothetical protein